MIRRAALFLLVRPRHSWIAILNRLRHYLPHARSLFMDEVTLLDHRSFWGQGEKPIGDVAFSLSEYALRHFY